MTMHFFNLPYELRQQIYSELFGRAVARFDGGRQDSTITDEPCLFPASTDQCFRNERSAQILRTCKAVYHEAQSLLYQQTSFVVSCTAFAGRLPTHFSAGQPFIPYIKTLRFQLVSDMLRYYNPQDMRMTRADLEGVTELQLLLQAENWKKLFCGTWHAEKQFVEDREAIVGYARLLGDLMTDGQHHPVTIVGDQKHLSRGRMMLRLVKGGVVLGPHEALLEQWLKSAD